MNTLTFTLDMGGEGDTLTLSAPTFFERRTLVSQLRRASEPPPELPAELKELGMSIKDALSVKEFKDLWDAWEQRNSFSTTGALGVTLLGIAAINGQKDKRIPIDVRNREFVLWRDLEQRGAPVEVGNWIFQQLSLVFNDGADRFNTALQWAIIASSGVDPQEVEAEIDSFRGAGERPAGEGSVSDGKRKTGRAKANS